LLVLQAQGFDASAQRRVAAGLGDQASEDTLHIALAVLELAPIFLHILRLLAAQQHVFPFLHLHLELQVGFVDQLRSEQRPVNQTAITLHPVGEEVETGQGDQQYRQQAATEQRQDLCSQGGSQNIHRGKPRYR